MVAQLAREAGAYVIGTGRAADRQTVLDFGAKEFVDLDNDAMEDVGGVDLVFDVIGGDIGKRSAGPSRPSTMPLPPSTRPSDARGRRSSAFVRERHAPIGASSRPALARSAGCFLSTAATERQPWLSC
jgi:hypothetical protein